MKALFVLLLAILLLGCSTSQELGEWQPLRDSFNDEDAYFEEKGMPSSTTIFDGLAFWESSPLIYEPPQAFHIYGKRIRLLITTEPNKSAKKELLFGDCPGLEEQARLLSEAIGKSGSMMTDDKVWVHVPVTISPRFYKIKSFPQDMVGSITLTNIKSDRMPWVQKAIDVFNLSKSCLDDFES